MVYKYSLAKEMDISIQKPLFIGANIHTYYIHTYIHTNIQTYIYIYTHKHTYVHILHADLGSITIAIVIQLTITDKVV